MANPTTEYLYDRAGQRIAMIDPLERRTNYEYDDAVVGNMLSSSGPDFAYDYQLDRLDRVTDIGIDLAGLLPDVDLAVGYDLASNRTSLSAAVGVESAVGFSLETMMPVDW
jgi:YD repeat-containing protein